MHPAVSPIPRPLAAPPTAIPQGIRGRVRRNMPGTVAFYALCLLCMGNINFITRALASTEQVFSVLYLIAAIATLLAFGGKPLKALGPSGRLWLVSMVAFLVVSTRLGLGIDKAYFLSPQSNLYRLLAAQLIVVAAAAGARHMVLTGRTQIMLRILFGIAMAAACTILIARYFPALLRFAGTQTQGRSAGFFSDANRAGQAVCITAGIGFATLVGEKTNLMRLLVYAALTLLALCLFVTFSRSAIVFMVVLVLLQLVVSPIFHNKQTLVGIVLLAACVPLGVNIVLSQRTSAVRAKEHADAQRQKERMQSFFKIMRGEATEQDFGHRFTVAAVGLKYFVNSPVIGAGFRKLAKMPEVNLGCHNTFLRIFGEAGIFVGMLYVAVFVYGAWLAFFCPNPEIRCFVLSFLAMMCCAQMVSHSILTNRLVNIGLGVSFGMLSAMASTAVSKRPRARRVPVLPH